MRRFAIALRSGAAALALGCADAGAPRSPRLVLLYATCTLNKDFLSPYDENVRFTPHLKAFARRSVVFERHQTESGQSGIAYASIFSGTQASQHGVYTIPQKLSPDVLLVSEIFRDAGYETFAWLAHSMASVPLNYAQGVEPSRAFNRLLTGRDPHLGRVLERLGSDEDYKALLLTNFTVTHGPYTGQGLQRFCRTYADECASLPEPATRSRLRKLYMEHYLALSFDFDATVERLGLSDAEVSDLAALLDVLYKAGVFHLDALFGELLDRIAKAGLLDETLVVFTADHGEVLYRENAIFKWSHALQLASEVLSVPLILYAPVAGVRPGTYEGVTRSIDVLPTLAGLSGVAIESSRLAGRDLSAALRGEEPPPRLLAFSHTALLPPPVEEISKQWGLFHTVHPRRDPELMWVSLRDRDRVYKLLSLNGKDFHPEIYDLAADPFESRNLFDAASQEQARMIERLGEYKSLLVEAHRADTFAERDLDFEHQAELLRSLGYID